MRYPDRVRWIIGDVQGCAREFEALLEAIRFDPSRDQAWLAGDLINRGPDTVAALELWWSTGGRAVLGNHEVYALCVHAGRWPRKEDTLQGLFDHPDADLWLGRLRDLPVLIELPDERDSVWLVHAGLDPRWTDLRATASRINALPHPDAWLEHPDVEFATRVRLCNAAGERVHYHGPPSGAPAGYVPWDTLYEGPDRVVHGHWAARGHYRNGKVIGIDSGCVYGHPMTAYCVEEDRIVQVPAGSRATG